MFIKKFICSLPILFAAVSWGGGGVTLDAREEVLQPSNESHSRIRITNQGSTAIVGFTLAYYFTVTNGKTPDPYCTVYYPSGTPMTLENLGSGQWRATLDFSNIMIQPGQTYPDQSGLVFGLHNSDWSTWDLSDDWSSPHVYSFVTDANVVLTSQGQTIWGNTPGTTPQSSSAISSSVIASSSSSIVVSSSSTIASSSSVALSSSSAPLSSSSWTDAYFPLLVISAFRPTPNAQGHRWVELYNRSAQNISLSGWSLHSLDGLNFNLGNDSLASGTPMLLDQLSSMETAGSGVLWLEHDGQKKFAVSFCSGNTDRSKLASLDSTLWRGQCIQLTSNAAGSFNYYGSNTAVALAKLARGNKAEQWNILEGVPGQIANGQVVAQPKFPLSGITLQITAQENASGVQQTFAWAPVAGSSSYRLKIKRANDAALFVDTIVHNNQANIHLPGAGTYNWSAIPDGAVGINADTLQLGLITLDYYPEPYATGGIQLNVPMIAARKDTKLLDLNWGQYSLSVGWDESHTDLTKYPTWNNEESYRCWAAGLQMINNYWGGNLTQDEIKMYVQDSLCINTRADGSALYKDDTAAGLICPQVRTPESSLKHGIFGAENAVNFLKGLAWELNIDSNSIIWNTTFPTPMQIEASLSLNAPLLVEVPGHIMVLSGIRKRFSGDYEVQLQNIDNNGAIRWVLYSPDTAGTYYLGVPSTRLKIKHWTGPIPQNGVPVRNSNPDVSLDSDNDGVMDYDEEMRFLTKKDDPDSDHDGVHDKQEILTYTLRVLSPDIDGDGLRNELDWDSDNDGISDGDEDKNGNGFLENGETDPEYSASATPATSSLVWPLYDWDATWFGRFAMWGFNSLSVNDNAECFVEWAPNTWKVVRGQDSTSPRCWVGGGRLSLMDTTTWVSQPVVTIGANAVVGRVAARGNVFLRDCNYDFGSYPLFWTNLTVTPQWTERFNPAWVTTLQLVQNPWYPTSTILMGEDENFFAPPMPNQVFSPVGWDPKAYDMYYSNAPTVDVAAGSSDTLNPHLVYNSVTVRSGGTLKLISGNYDIRTLDIESGATLLIADGSADEKVFVNAISVVAWRGSVNTTSGLNCPERDKFDYVVDAGGQCKLLAQRFMLHVNSDLFIEGDFYGTIFTYRHSVSIGQTVKAYWGAAFAKDLQVHQRTHYHVVPMPEWYKSWNTAVDATEQNMGSICAKENTCENFR